MPTSDTSSSNSLALTSAVIATAGVFGIALGLMYPLLAMILKKQGISATLIGVNSAMTPLGGIVSAPLIPRFAQRFGAARLAVLCAALTALTLLFIGAFQQIVFWFPMRFILGMVLNGPYVISETWINSLAISRNRGRIMGFYTTILAAGFALGPFLLAITGSSGWPPFLVVIIIITITAVGLFFIRLKLPDLVNGEKVSVREFISLGALLLIGVGVFSFFDQSTLALLPVYGLHFGLSERIMAIALGVMISGNVLMQYPIGWAADRLSRRGVMMGCALMTVAGSLALPFVITSKVLLWPMLFLWGAVAFGVYTVALAELGDRFSGTRLLAGNAAFAMMWGIGGIVGAPIAGAAMDLLGPHGLPAILGSLFAVLAVLAALKKTNLRENGRNSGKNDTK